MTRLITRCVEGLVDVDVKLESKIDSLVPNWVLQAIQNRPLSLVFDHPTQVEINGTLRMQVEGHSVANKRKKTYNEGFEEKWSQLEQHFM